MTTAALPSESDLHARHPSCPVCLHGDIEPTSVELQDTPRIELVHCVNCAADFASRFPKSEYLTDLYAPSHYEPDLNSNPGATSRLGRRLANWTDRYWKPDQIRVLDFGGADGSLLQAFEQHLPARFDRASSSFVVADLFPQDLGSPLSYVQVEDLFSGDARFDLVIASAVIEHLPNLRDDVLALAQRLDTGGLFYGRTPWEKPLARALPGYEIRWPRHLFDLGPEFWEGSATNLFEGFELLESRTSSPDSDLRVSAGRTTFAAACKGASHLERLLLHRGEASRPYLWRFAGSWEALLRKT